MHGRFSGSERNCDGLNRRGFLKAGFLGLGGLSLADALALRARAADAGSTRRRTAVIYIELNGGPTHFETYDPKPEAPVEFRGPLEAIDTNVPGIRVCEVMSQQAKIMDKLAIVRSIHHTSASHGTSAHLTQTGYYLRDAQNRQNEMPSAASITASLRGANAPGLPAYVAMPREMRYGMSGWLGKGYNPFIVDGDPSTSEFQVRNLTLDGGLNLDRLNDRRDLLTSLDHLRRMRDGEGVSTALDQFSDQAFEMLTSDRARQAFDLEQERPETRDRYGRSAFGQGLLLSRRLVEAGVTFVTIRMKDSWDDHQNIADRMRLKGPAYDQGVAALVSDMFDRGLDRDVMVVAMGEFGRTPRVNKNAGRDHWGSVMSVLLSGGGLRMGQVVGSSNSKGEVPHDAPYRPENVLATVYRHLGIDPSATFNDLTGRPRYILEQREVISELI